MNRIELDSHATMTCVGKGARIMEVCEGQECNVYGFHQNFKPILNVNTVNVAYAYDSDDGKTYILHVNQALDFTNTLEHALLCPNQVRANGHQVHEAPSFTDSSSSHSIVINENEETINLPLLLDGTISYLPVRYPSDEDLNESQHLDLTYVNAWDPDNFGQLSYQATNRGVYASRINSLHISDPYSPYHQLFATNY